MTRAVVFMVIWVATACGGDDALLVRFLSQRDIPTQADSLEVVVKSPVDDSEIARHPYALSPGGFPATLEIVRGSATPPHIRIDAYLHLGTHIVAAGSAQVELGVGGQQDIRLVDVPEVRSPASATSSRAAS